LLRISRRSFLFSGVRFSFRQILASAAGAVIAARIASSLGVTGTIIGVAVGSMGGATSP
jgi:hypothetical protein